LIPRLKLLITGESTKLKNKKMLKLKQNYNKEEEKLCSRGSHSNLNLSKVAKEIQSK
jgi:5-formaminoimidazole-4-carboxamide-1-beta-D-ribofuranosyl 5'-monophosphate synthetase